MFCLLLLFFLLFCNSKKVSPSLDGCDIACLHVIMEIIFDSDSIWPSFAVGCHINVALFLAYNNAMEEWKKQTISRYFCCFSFSFLLAIRARKQHIRAPIIRMKKPHITLTHTSYQRKGEDDWRGEKRSFENYEFQNRRQHKLLHVFKVREEKTMENLFSQPFVKKLLDKFSVTIWSDGLRSKSSGAIAMEEFLRVLCCRWVDHHFHFHLQHHLAFYGSTLLMGGWNSVMNFFYDFLFSCFMCVWGWASAELRFHGNWKLIFLQ